MSCPYGCKSECINGPLCGGLSRRDYLREYEESRVEEKAGGLGMAVMRRATADCWYDFGFQSIAVYSRTGKFLKALHVPDQSAKWERRMRYLWGIHVTGRALLFALPSRVAVEI